MACTATNSPSISTKTFRFASIWEASFHPTEWARASIGRPWSVSPRRVRGRPFDPACLTEDYETGYLLHSLGYRQIFIPVRAGAAGPVATREYFPAPPAAGDLAAHTLGNRHRAAELAAPRLARPLAQLYWFWRDRKGLVGNLLSPAANLFFIYGTASYLGQSGTGWPVALREPSAGLDFESLPAHLRHHDIADRLCAPAMAARIYGWHFAAAVPIRMFWGNLVNFAATATALWEFWSAHVRGIQPAWRKTDHVYPVSQPAMATGVVRFHPMPDASPSVVVGESY